MLESNRSRDAVVFPGQGSQTRSMEDVIREHEPSLFEAACDCLGPGFIDRVGDATRFQQVAIYCAGIAFWTAVGRPSDAQFSGHSLGEITALTAAGVLDPIAGLKLVAERGAAMDAASEAEAGAMLALVGDRDLIDSLDLPGRTVRANDNSDRQVVLSGPADEIGAARRTARAAGLKAVELPVSGAFHSPLMQPALDRYRRALERTEFKSAQVTVFSCVTAAPFDDIRNELLMSLVSPVRWRDVMSALYDRGVRRFIEPGPGTVLSKLAVSQFGDRMQVRGGLDAAVSG